MHRLVFAAVLLASLQIASPPAEKLDEFIRATRAEDDWLTAAVAHQGRLVYGKAFGSANTETKEALTLDHVWAPSAISRYFAAAVIASLAADGTIAVDRPIAAYWPDLDPQLGRVTLRQLLQNRAGIRDEHVDYAILERDALARFAAGCDARCIIAEPDYVTSASSRSPNIAVAVVEHATRKSFDELLTATILSPLGLKRSALSILQVATHPIALGHVTRASGREVVRPLAANWVGWPATSVFTSTRDAVTFAGALANQGVWEGRQIFAPAVVAETFRLLQSKSEPLVSGTSWAGIRASSALVPDAGFAVVVFDNAPNANDIAPKVNAAARRIWLGEASVPAPPPAAAATASKVTESRARELTGLYRNEYDIALEWRNGSLWFRDLGTYYRKPSTAIEVMHLEGDVYVLAERHAPYGTDLSVVRSPAGVVTHIFHGARAFRREPRQPERF